MTAKWIIVMQIDPPPLPRSILDIALTKECEEFVKIGYSNRVEYLISSKRPIQDLVYSRYLYQQI